MASPWYFALLEIDATDDVRVIRRAYATALKRIDQETQQDDFARLRRAYELAQRWQRDDDEQTAPDQAAAQAEPAPDQAGAQHGAALDPAGNDRHNGFALTPVPVLLGGAANQQTGAGASDNVHAERPRNLKDTAELFQAFAVLVLAKPDAADVLLREALADDALISLVARAEFEREVAQWLSNHRYPHAPLLEASVGEFGWDDRLPTLAAPVALWLRHVIDERSIYLAKAEPWRAHVHQAIDLAAQTKVAVPRDQLVACLEALDGAARHCPDWLALHLLPEQTRSWLALAAKAAQPTRWEVFHSTLRARLRESKIGWLALVVLACIVGTRMLSQEDGRSPGANPPPAFSRPLTSFKVNPALCAARARLGGRWAQLYDNELTYRSFKAEVTDCLDANLWPGGQTSADDYLQRLKHAWRNASDPDNASLVGYDVPAPSESGRGVPRVCDEETNINPDLDPSGARCVALAATYTPEQVPSFPVSEQFCADRADTGGNWHFDPPDLWRGYLSFKQEVDNCMAANWWPGGQRAADDYLRRLKLAWRIASNSGGQNIVAEQATSRLTVGRGGRLVMGANGVQIDGDVRVNGKPLAPANDALSDK